MAIEVGGSGGSGGVFVPDFNSKSLTIPSGTSAGVIIGPITPPSDKRVRITNLSSGASSDITVKINSTAMITSGKLGDSASSVGDFAFGKTGDANAGIYGMALGVDDTFTVESAGTTGNDIHYTYETGEVK